MTRLERMLARLGLYFGVELELARGCIVAPDGTYWRAYQATGRARRTWRGRPVTPWRRRGPA